MLCQHCIILDIMPKFTDENITVISVRAVVVLSSFKHWRIPDKDEL